MKRNVLPVIGIALMAGALPACMIEGPVTTDDCAYDPTYCPGYPGQSSSCFSDVDCIAGSYCSRLGSFCVGSNTCSRDPDCRAGFHCDGRSTCVPAGGQIQQTAQ